MRPHLNTEERSAVTATETHKKDQLRLQVEIDKEGPLRPKLEIQKKDRIQMKGQLRPQ